MLAARSVPTLLLLVVLVLTGCSDEQEQRRAAPTAAATPSASAAAPAAESPSPTPQRRPVRLTGDGIDAPEGVISFGDGYDEAAAALREALGEPTLDTGVEGNAERYGFCPGSKLRGLEFADGALYFLFGDVPGPGLTMYQWTLTGKGRPAEVPPASALVGDVTTYEFAVGDTVGGLREGSQGAELEVRPGDEVFDPSFSLQDQSSGFFGYLTGTADADRITLIQAGEACGE